MNRATSDNNQRTSVGTSGGSWFLWLILLLGLGYGLLVPTMAIYPRSRKSARMSLEVSTLRQAMELFKLEVGVYPPDFAGNDNDDQKQITMTLEALKVHGGAESITTRNLDPSEALVFWLHGFSREAGKPLTGKNKRAFYDFDQSRLRDQDGDGFEEYYPLAKAAPFVYFRIEPHETEFDGEHLLPARLVLSGAVAICPYLADDTGCDPKNFEAQIICAGLDDAFGSGGVYPSGIGYSVDDDDNITSFSGGKALEDSIP